MKQTVSFKKNAVNLFFHILTSCNLSCRHCYINQNEHGSDTLEIDTINHWLDLFREKANEANVIFLGGEPTMHPDLAVAVKKARDLKYKSITIDTNGYLYHDILSKVTPDDVDFMSFSLDGATEETNDALRGEGCYKKCIEGIKDSVKKGFNTSLIYTVSESNMHELKDMPGLLKELGVKHFFIQVIGIRGNSSTNEDISQVSKDNWEKLVPEVAKKVGESGISVTYPKVFLGPDETFECGGNVAENYFVFPNGRVYTCPLCEDYPLHAYTIEENKLIPTAKINEKDLFKLEIPEGCVINKLVQDGNIEYKEDGTPSYKIACCLLKEEIIP
ncbi:MAG: radical SAM protein [Desulfobacterales bacterium]|nr:radical SAM protein [Desulfobacterales bacterium]MCP4161553.1 radical SAM protein [Deltaproteobacteria bacterium]